MKMLRSIATFYGLPIESVKVALDWLLFASGFAWLIWKFLFPPRGREINVRILEYLTFRRDPDDGLDQAIALVAERL
jgi:hypothetical protein